MPSTPNAVAASGTGIADPAGQTDSNGKFTTPHGTSSKGQRLANVLTMPTEAKRLWA